MVGVQRMKERQENRWGLGEGEMFPTDFRSCVNWGRKWVGKIGWDVSRLVLTTGWQKNTLGWRETLAWVYKVGTMSLDCTNDLHSGSFLTVACMTQRNSCFWLLSVCQIHLLWWHGIQAGYSTLHAVLDAYDFLSWDEYKQMFMKNKNHAFKTTQNKSIQPKSQCLLMQHNKCVWDKY